MEGNSFNIDISKLREDHYAWLQVIEGQPRQAFTHNEMLVYNLFPSTDVEHNGYPVSPLDTCVNCVTTHISIEAFWKTYFSNGKSAKGMLVIKSEEVDQQMIDAIKMQFNASINSVSNAFRTPIFGISTTDDVQWTPTQDRLENGEFSFTYDQVARNILSAFGVSPDEIPGYGHLSKGTNSQTLSESNNEFKMTAARDSGLRPLILGWQTYFNQRLLPIIDPEMAQIVEVKLSGLDAQSKEQESARLQQDSTLFHTYDSLLAEVDEDGPGKAFGGDVPFNERYRQVLDFYSSVGEVRSKFFGDPSALIDPLLKFKRDPFALQWIQLLVQVNPNAIKAMAAPKKHNLEFLKMEIEDMLEDDGTGE
jgi:phage portal protein BeeE